MTAKEGERRGLAELMANLEEQHPARRDYEQMAASLRGCKRLVENATMVSDRERIEFIRRAAIAIVADASWNPEQREQAMGECWEIAQALWKAKPDEC